MFGDEFHTCSDGLVPQRSELARIIHRAQKNTTHSSHAPRRSRKLCAVKQMNSCEGLAQPQNTNGANELVCLQCAAMMHEEEPQPRVTDMLVVQFCNGCAHGPVAISLVLLQERFASAPVHTKHEKPLALDARKGVGSVGRRHFRCSKC